MAFYMNMMALNEGEQAREYLKKKQAQKDKEKKEYDRKYEFRPGVSVYGDRIETSGPGGSREKRVRNDPAYDQAKNMNDLRKEFKDVMPKKLSKAEEKVKKIRDDYEKESDYAYDMVKRAGVDQPFMSQKGNEMVDAAKRHYRRHVKESGIFAECYFLDEE